MTEDRDRRLAAAREASYFDRTAAADTTTPDDAARAAAEAARQHVVAGAGTGALGRLVEWTDQLVAEGELVEQEDAAIRADVAAAAERDLTVDGYIADRDLAINHSRALLDADEDGWW